MAIPPTAHQYFAKDKVALLIGNGEYFAEKELSAPPNDILQIGNKLKKMGFKTLICKNLTKASMEGILDFFVNLLVEDGVYGKKLDCVWSVTDIRSFNIIICFLLY